jgi:hypothetical protein
MHCVFSSFFIHVTVLYFIRILSMLIVLYPLYFIHVNRVLSTVFYPC